MEKISITVGLGNFYSLLGNGFAPLPFVYKNIKDLQTSLTGWKNSQSLLDDTASCQNINDKLIEVIDSCASNDWVLFYYTGHAIKYYLSVQPQIVTKTTCATYNRDIRVTNLPPLAQLFSELDYEKIVARFGEKVPDGHLITILDCCYAYGLIDTFAGQKNFHTIIAASSTETSARFDTNSLFFQAFSIVELENVPFGQMQARLDEIYLSRQYPGKCQVKAASNFQTHTLNNIST